MYVDMTSEGFSDRSADSTEDIFTQTYTDMSCCIDPLESLAHYLN